MRKHIQHILQDVVLSGGKKLKQYFNSFNINISQKTDHHNLVTTADKASEKAILESINYNMKRFGYKENDYAFISEETVKMPEKHHLSQYLFIIDPLDGTANFASNIPIFSIYHRSLEKQSPYCWNRV